MMQRTVGGWTRLYASRLHQAFASRRSTVIAQVTIAMLLWLIAAMQMR